jgi:hypothetical protein
MWLMMQIRAEDRRRLRADKGSGTGPLASLSAERKGRGSTGVAEKLRQNEEKRTMGDAQDEARGSTRSMRRWNRA